MNKTKIIELLNELVDNNQLPGYSLALIDGDETYKYYYGYRRLIPSKQEVNENTLYDLASLSKVVSTTTCILKLQEEGLININDKVSKYLDIKEKDITILECLTHTTGIESDIPNYKDMNDEEFINSIMSQPSLKEYKGLVHYSDINFIYLGFIINKLKGSLDKYAEEVIFKPLKMNHTSYNPKDKDNAAATEVKPDRGVVQGEVHDGKAYRLKGVGGSSGVFSNLDDILKFVIALINEDSFLSKTSYELIKHPLKETKTGNRAAGWIISDPTTESLGKSFSSSTIYHTGFTGGSIYVDFINKKALILLTNRVHPNRNNDSILKLRPKLHELLYK